MVAGLVTLLRASYARVRRRYGSDLTDAEWAIFKQLPLFPAVANVNGQCMIIPSPDAAGYFHFLYRSTDPVSGEWYGGKRSTTKHPTTDRYKGSGNWVRRHPARERLIREIIAFYPSSTEVYAAEAEMITCAVLMDDALCMNQRAGGDGFTVEDRQRAQSDPNFRANMIAGITKRSSNLKWRKNQTASVRRVTSTVEWKVAQAAGSKKRSEDPVWIENNAATAKRLAADPTWIANHSQGVSATMADPAWGIAHATGCKKRSENPEWVTNVAAAGRRRMTSDEWKAAHLLRSQDPVFQATLSEVGTKKWADPDWRANMLAARAIGRAERRAAGIVPADTTVFVILNGKRVSLKEACRQTGMSYNTAYDRFRRGVPESEWLIPPRKKKTIP